MDEIFHLKEQHFKRTLRWFSMWTNLFRFDEPIMPD